MRWFYIYRARVLLVLSVTLSAACTISIIENGPDRGSVSTANDAGVTEATQSFEEVSIDFSENETFDLSFHKTEQNEGVLLLKEVSSGHYAEEGYIDVSLPDTYLLYGKTIFLRSERVNSFTNGDFENGGISSCVLGSDTEPDNDPDICGAAELGKWFAEREPNVAQTETLSNGNVVLKLNQRTAVQQFFKTSPGTLYRLSMGINTKCLTPRSADGSAPSDCNISNAPGALDDDNKESQVVSIKYQAHLSANSDDAIDPERMDFTHLYLLASHNQIRLKKFDDRQAWRGERLRFRTLDCDDHVLYEADAVAHNTTITKNACSTTDAENLVYGALSFGVSWYETSDYNDYFAWLDNVFLDREDQIEIVLLGANDEVLQSSTVSSGFLVETEETVAKIRIYLRTDVEEESPRVSKLQIVGAMPLEVTFNKDPRTEFNAPRMGMSGSLPPKANWDAHEMTSLKSYCKDFMDEGAFGLPADNNNPYDTIDVDNTVAPHCWRFLQKYGASRLRTFFPINVFKLDPAVPNPNQLVVEDDLGYERLLHRFTEMAQKDLDVLMLLMPLSDNEVQDLGGETAAQNYVTTYASQLAHLFDGNQTHVGSDTTIQLPLIDDFETFNEVNITDITWADAEGLTALQNDTCEALSAARSNINISSSGLSSGDNFFPTDYVTEHIDDLVCSGFTHSNFHPYAQGGQAPEDIGKSWVSHWGAVGNPTWANKSTFFGEYGFSHFKYDPYCGLTESGKYLTGSTLQKWVRGYGDDAMAKLVARATIKALQQPAAGIFYWSVFTNGKDAYGGDYHCWKRHETLNHHMFDEVENATFDLGENHLFESNSAGKAWLRIAKHLSTSSPHITSIERLGNMPQNNDEHYFAAAFTVDDVRYLALWWYKEYLLGNLQKESNSAFLNYIEGTMDNGFTTRRGHTVVLSGANRVSTAIRYDLSTGLEETVEITISEDGDPVLKNIPLGEMPVLVRLQ